MYPLSEASGCIRVLPELALNFEQLQAPLPLELSAVTLLVER
jgi:hypothetical protein